MDKNAAAAGTNAQKLQTTAALLSSGPAKEVSSVSSRMISSGDVNFAKDSPKRSSSSTNPSSISSPLLTERASKDHLRPKELQLSGRKFKPKFSPLELKVNPLQHAIVFISDALLPNSVYIQFQDEDFSRYHQMLRDLELDFNLATRRSASFCPSPIPGSHTNTLILHSNYYCIFIVKSLNLFIDRPYAVHLSNRWRRVLVEMSSSRRGVLEVFNVDTGFRTVIQPDMEFYELPQR